MSKKCALLSVGIMSGNSVSHSNRKTRRKFYPNLKSVVLKSETLGVNLTLKVATSSLRTVNKYGNIDNFLVNYKYAKLADKARKLRTQIKKKLIKAGKLDEVQFAKEVKKVTTRKVAAKVKKAA